jgi:hypothetical protein
MSETVLEGFKYPISLFTVGSVKLVFILRNGDMCLVLRSFALRSREHNGELSHDVFAAITVIVMQFT